MLNTQPFPVIRDDHGTGGAHRRRISWVTVRHRMLVTVLVSVTTAVLYLVQQVLWPHSAHPHGLLAEAWSWAGLTWTIAFVPAVFELAGLYMWKAPRFTGEYIPYLVCWRIVSRGINKEALRDTIFACRQAMQDTPLFPYIIEVVVDTDASSDGLPAEGTDLRYIRVPQGYQTRAGTKAKARALNYALETSPLPATAWIVHMDEESRPRRSGIMGIAQAIREEEETGRLRIGQGTITYHRDWKNHPFFTLSDCIRTGSDLGRLYLSMRVGVPLFGLHGSYILVRNDVEKYVGFDIGPVGSLTEDAWWGTLAMDAGVRCRWVDGHVSEQCTHKVPDFLKQRRRWFTGLFRTALFAPSSLRWRAVMIVSMLAWASAPVSWLYTIGHLVDGGYTPPAIRALANVSLAVYIATTLVGLRVNMREHGIWHPLQKVRWAVTWLVCLPVFSLLESTAVGYAILRPAKGFHVVKK